MRRCEILPATEREREMGDEEASVLEFAKTVGTVGDGVSTDDLRIHIAVGGKDTGVDEGSDLGGGEG
jgi:hypothetical protein